VANPQNVGWMRASTPYSGHGKRQLFTPEVGSQVLVGYEQSQAEFPLVLGNLFHPQNPQQAKYSTPQNQLKGLQTAGGNKVVMSDAKDAQTILLSNSNNKGPALQLSFAGDGSVHIQSNGPVTVNGSVITLGAGVPGKGQTAYTGEIIMRAKNITMEAEELVRVSSKAQDVEIVAKEVLAFQGREVNGKATEQMQLDGGTKLTADSADSNYL
jgi:type VI secretion system secreted protein VgrG